MLTIGRRMLGLGLVRPLEDDWREVLDRLAVERGWPSSRQVAALGSAVKELSAAYNDPARARAAMRVAGAARLGFGFVRDVPKGGAAMREVMALLAGQGELRVLDLGAGLGAMTWGLVRALAAAKSTSPVLATWIDSDPEALALAARIVSERADPALPAAHVRCMPGSLSQVRDLGQFDVVLLGQVLSEVSVGAPDSDRVEEHASLLRDLLESSAAPGGFLVVVEPALRDRTRHLHRVRDALAARGLAPFAPCLHAGACPALAEPSDWCHEDLPVDLPGWLVPVARAAGLRYQGLTFSYLVLRRGQSGRRPAGLVESLTRAEGIWPLRVVSDRIKTKGKSEALLCGKLPQGEGWTRGVRLDRDARPGNDAWERARRGDLVLVQPPPRTGGRIDATSSVTLCEVQESR